jgi:AraC-like DNA-binding protein
VNLSRRSGGASLDDLATLAARQLPPRGPDLVRPLPKIGVFRQPRTSTFEASLFDPVVVLVLQGRKEVALGADSFSMSRGELLLVSHDLPVMARITRAPYLALLFDVDVPVLRDLFSGQAAADAGASALSVHPGEPRLVDALTRYLALAENPTEAEVLGPLVEREILYRLATAPFGAMLRSLVHQGSYASSIARAIAHLRRDFRGAIEVPELARSVGMSASSFHKHFKAITASSPLRFQKELRLLEARRLLRSGAASVATAAFEVGYESPTQFSREYTRKFGAPPKRDLPTR